MNISTMPQEEAPYHLDVDEIDVLKKYANDNPKFVSFKETDNRIRTLEERFVEADLEKAWNSAHAAQQQRRSLYTKDLKAQPLPVHPTLPFPIDLRRQRNKLIDDAGHVDHLERNVSLADVLMKEVALSEETIHQLPNVLVLLQEYYRGQIEMLPRKHMRYIERWMTICGGGGRDHNMTGGGSSSQTEDIIQQAENLKKRLILNMNEKMYCEDALDRITTYKDMMSLMAKKTPEHGTHKPNDLVDDTRSATLVLEGRVPQDLNPSDVKVHLRAESFKFQTRKRWQRFASKSQFMALSKRRQCHSNAIHYLSGGEAAEGGERGDSVPLMPTTDNDVVTQLDDLASCFRLSGHDKSDVQEFMYHLGKRYQAVYCNQNEFWVFTAAEPVAMSAKAALPPVKEGTVRAEGFPTFLRMTNWEESMSLEVQTPVWQQEQQVILANAVTKPNEHLLAEREFLEETDAPKTTQRWKERVESHHRRATVRPRHQGSTLEVTAAMDENEGDEGGGKQNKNARPSSSHQRILALYELRYLRIREFRRKLLSMINYYASLHRQIARDCQTKTLANTVSGNAKVKVAPISPDLETARKRQGMTPMVRVEDEVVSADVDTFASKLLDLYGRSSQVAQAINGAAPSNKDPTGSASSPSTADQLNAAEWAMRNGPDASVTNLSNGCNLRCVLAPEGHMVMHDWAIKELEKLESSMLTTASYYVNRQVAEHHRTAQIEVDYFVVLEDIYENEVWYQEGKLKTIDCFREAYEHTVDPQEQADIGRQMLQLIAARPRLDLNDSYFVPSYTHEVINLELLSTLLHEMIDSQIQEERRIRNGLAWSSRKKGASNTNASTTDSQSLSALDERQYGHPDPSIQGAKLFGSLFPGASVTNALDIYTSLGVLGRFQPLLLHTVASLTDAVGLSNHATGVHLMTKEILQEMLVQWRLLGEEDRIVRQMQRQQQQSTASSPTAGSGYGSAGGSAGGNRSNNQASEVNEEILDSHYALNDIETLDGVLRSIAETDGSAAAAAGSGALPSSIKGRAMDYSTKGNPSDGNGGLNDPSALFILYMAAMELYHVRSTIMQALFETELLYNVHRQQAKLMGISVKKLQFEAIDFETRKTFGEIDEVENLRDLSSLAQDELEAAENNVLSVKNELLSNLAIAEFEHSMAKFDFNTVDGLKRVLTHGVSDFRRALTAQMTTKNLLISVIMCNQVPLDVYYNGLLRSSWLKVVKGEGTFTTQQVGGDHDDGAGLSETGTAQHQQKVRCRLVDWPIPHHKARSGEDEEACAKMSGTDVDKAMLQKLYISVNQIKSLHRKCILNEMNTRTSDVLSSKKPELLRRKIKELKNELVGEYCLNMMLACYQYAVKYQACTYATHLRGLCLTYPTLNSFFTLGSRSDIIRPQPRAGGAGGGESRRVPTCMITRNAMMDDPRYIPHIMQILTMTFDSKERPGAQPGQGGQGGKEALKPHEHIHNHGHTHFRSNCGTTLVMKVLFHWCGLTELVQAQAMCRLSVIGSLKTPQAAVESWRQDLIHLNAEIENLPDVSCVSSVIDLLEHKHISVFLRLLTAHSSMGHVLQRQGSTIVAGMVRREGHIFQERAGYRQSQREQTPKLNWPSTEHHLAANAMRTAEYLRMNLSPYYEHIARIRALRTNGQDFETSIVEAENTPAGALPLPPHEKHLYQELELNGYYFVGDCVRVPYRQAGTGRLNFLLQCTTEEREGFLRECKRIDTATDEANEDYYETVARTAQGDIEAGSLKVEPSSAQWQVALRNARRDRLQELYYMLLQSVGRTTGDGHHHQPTVMSPAQLDELFTRNVFHKSKIMLEKEQNHLADKAESNGGAGRKVRRGRVSEKDLLGMQVFVLETEINKLLIQRTTQEVKAVQGQLEGAYGTEGADGLTRLGVGAGSNSSMTGEKMTILTDFINILMSRAVLVRDDTERIANYHIPEVSLNLALDTVGKRLKQWNIKTATEMAASTDSIVQQLYLNLVKQDHRIHHQQHLRQVDQKAVQRRVQAKIVDSKYDLLFCNDALAKENATLRHQLDVTQNNIREEVRIEYEEVVADLKRQLMLSQSQFASYQKKLYRDMQVSLEEIKRNAMLSVGKMDNAPLHMKREALKRAIADDETNMVKEQNNELRQAVTKTKLWYEMKLLRLRAAHEKQMQGINAEVEQGRSKYWGDKETTEKAHDELKHQLGATQNQLSQSELEVEQLRKDLQLQLSNKKDLVTWKVQNAKRLDDLEKKVKYYERTEKLDLDRGDHHGKQQATTGGTGSGNMSVAHNSVQRNRPVSTTHSTLLSRTGTASPRSDLAARPGSRGFNTTIASSVNHDEVTRLKDQLGKERKLKEKAFGKIESLKQGQDTANDLVWQRKYFEVASELQRTIREVEQMKAAGINLAPKENSNDRLTTPPVSKIGR